jgi:hypothetical protein
MEYDERLIVAIRASLGTAAYQITMKNGVR